MISLSARLRVLLPNFFLILLAAGVSFAWSIGLDREWGTDYGTYYVGASALSNDYRLYNELFDHKGPAYYLFLRSIGTVIGFGPAQAIISLFLTVALYMGTVLALSSLLVKSPKYRLLVLLAGGTTLLFQPTNASMSLFQVSILLWSFYFLYRNIREKKEGLIYISALFFCVAVLTRIETALFFPMFILFGVVTNKSPLGYARFLLIFAAIFSAMHYGFSSILGYTFQQYVVHNILFNVTHSSASRTEVQYLLVKPGTFNLFMISGVPMLMLLIAGAMKERRQYVYFLFISVVGLAIFVLAGQDKNYFLFILYAPLLFWIIASINDIGFDRVHQYLFLLALLAYPNALLGLQIFAFRGDLRDGVFLALKSNEDRKLVADIKEIGNGYGIFERGWIYLFAEVQPKESLLALIYYPRYKGHEEFFLETGLAASHYKLVNAPGTEFVIVNGLVEDHPNFWMQELLDASCVVKDTGKYQVRKIGAECGK